MDKNYLLTMALNKEMARDKINPDNPVYISYAWGDDIEQDVDRICKIMRENGIEYKRDKEGLCPYRANIDEIEKIIGDGDAVIVVVSKKYLQSLHTMNEWHNIVNKGDISKRVFIILLEDAGINNYSNYVKYRENLNLEYQRCVAKHNDCSIKRVKPAVGMQKVEINSFLNYGFVDDLDVMFGYCRNYNRGASIEGKRENNFQDVIEPLKKYVKELADITNAKKTIKSLKSKIKILENQLKDSNAEKLQLINEIEEKDKEISSLLAKLEESKKIESTHQEGECTNIFNEFHKLTIEEEKRRIEQDEYNNLDNSNYNALYRYLHKYPNSMYKDELEDQMWKIVQETCTSLSLQNYIEDFPDGKYLTEAKAALAFCDTWDKLSKESDIFQVYSCLNTMDKTNLYFDRVESLYKSLREAELEKMRRNPSEYSQYFVDKLIDKGIFTEKELICENLMSHIPTINTYWLPNLNDLRNVDCMAYQDENCTDIYLFGVPAVGKTCLLMGLVASNGQGYNLSFATGSGAYASALQLYAEANVLPGPTNHKSFGTISGELIKSTKGKIITQDFNLIDMSGEEFVSNMVNGPTICFSDMEISLSGLLNNQHRKCFLIVIDPTRQSVYDSQGYPRRQQFILQKFVNIIASPENQNIMKNVESIHFVITKADMLGKIKDEQKRNAQAFMQNEFIATINALKIYCQETGRINITTAYEPHFFTFSLGRFYIGGKFEYNKVYSLQFIDSLKSMISNQDNKSFLSKLFN